MDQNLSIQDTFEDAAEGIPMSASLQAARALGQPKNEATFTAAESRAAYIRGYSVTDGADKKPVIGTNQMIPCIAVAIYNPATKTGAMTHFDVRADVHSLQMLMDELGHGKDKLDIHIAGGQLGSEHSHELAEDLIKVIEQNPNATIRTAELLSTNGGSKSLALDTRTGEVYYQFRHTQLDKGPNRQDEMMFHASTVQTVGPLRPNYVRGQEFGLEDWKESLKASSPASYPNSTPAISPAP